MFESFTNACGFKDVTKYLRKPERRKRDTMNKIFVHQVCRGDTA